MKRRPTSRCNRRAFLLVEATLTAAVIAIGLVAVTRGMSASLTTLTRLQQYDHLLRLAESKLHELEVLAPQGQAIQAQEQSFDAPDQAYRWTVRVRPVSLQSAGVPDDTVRAVDLMASAADHPTPVVALHVLWPKEWVKE